MGNFAEGTHRSVAKSAGTNRSRLMRPKRGRAGSFLLLQPLQVELSENQIPTRIPPQARVM